MIILAPGQNVLYQYKESLKNSENYSFYWWKTDKVIPLNKWKAYELLKSPVKPTLFAFQLVVKLGRALKKGEQRVKVYLLQPNEQEVGGKLILNVTTAI